MIDDREFLVAKLNLSPGDVLVVKFDVPLSSVAAVRVREQFQDKLPDGVKVLIIERGIDLSVLTFDEIQQRATA